VSAPQFTIFAYGLHSSAKQVCKMHSSVKQVMQNAMTKCSTHPTASVKHSKSVAQHTS